jgi:hypothetical protein
VQNSLSIVMRFVWAAVEVLAGSTATFVTVVRKAHRLRPPQRDVSLSVKT